SGLAESSKRSFPILASYHLVSVGVGWKDLRSGFEELKRTKTRYSHLSSNSRAVLQPNFRLYDRAALYTEANLILVLQAHRPRIAGIAGRTKCSMFAT